MTQRHTEKNHQKFVKIRENSWQPLILLLLTLLLTPDTSHLAPDTSHTNRQPPTTIHHPLTLDFPGPYATENDTSPNPFLTYRLQVTFTAPSGNTYNVPGFFAGDGNGLGLGNIWRVRFTPDEVGEWQYLVSFRFGDNLAINLDPTAGTPLSFDGTEDTFTVTPRDPTAPGFLKYGRLEYVGEHYLKFRDGPYFIKSGTNSPENLLGYQEFDETFDQGGLPSGIDFTHLFAPHIDDWNPDDPTWLDGKGQGLIGALNYLSAQGVNAVYLLPMNLGGDGQETYPFVAPENTPFNKTHYDVSKLHQWNIALNHAQERGIQIQFVLSETEIGNETWLDNGALGTERKLYFRELVARFGYLLGVKWNLGEESDFSVAQLQAHADYLRALDPYNHPIAVHTHLDSSFFYSSLVGDDRFDITSFQYTPELASDFIETWRENSESAGRKWVLDMDENAVALTDINSDELRKRVLYDVYFSGGNLEWYMGYFPVPPTEIGGDISLEDFATRQEMWQMMRIARNFVETHLPFWEMTPNDSLLTGEDSGFGGAEVFAKLGEVYAIYIPDASPAGSLNLLAASNTDKFVQLWFNPRTGTFEGSATYLYGGALISLGTPPSDPGEDWVVLVRRVSEDNFLPILHR